MKTKQQLFKDYCTKQGIPFSGAIEARQAGLKLEWKYNTCPLIMQNHNVYNVQRKLHKQILLYNSNRLYKWLINTFYSYSYMITLNQLINEFTQALINPDQAREYLSM